ncbi:MAG TPA: PAS domain-containing protein [Candidatus Avimonoglobus intestinipullorum]|uniref:PAS domain-containing protein n=1 Tax=Candidatus Avimonoglobus intestinipullorum TaxID=2840699 RepID=A0A9D1LUP2_9FIRM|nr:PAS domain-containing protein [Candidatus Avimonoglobus intestinipullorum]
MSDCIQLKKSNCKDCYKCIRNCPVKSIKFSEHQAHIIPDECILCGMCFVSCPQNAKQIRNDVDQVKALFESGRPVYASVAPSFVANYEGISIDSMERALQKLGFAGASETAIGATIVKKEYENMIRRNKNSVIISSCCHSVNTLIQKYYPEALPYLAKVLSPMQAHCQKIKQEHPGAATVFIGPCISKKDEAEQYPEYVDVVLTFEELSGWLQEAEVAFDEIPDSQTKARARLFPTAGGIIRSMDLDEGMDYIAVDGVDQCMTALDDILDHKIQNCFIEMSACKGSCVGGPVMDRERHMPVRDFVAVNRYAGTKDFDVTVPEAISKTMNFQGTRRQMPGSSAIDEILRQMGKTTPDQMLNCGSCGYNTCRDKAIAVFNGKADLTMCLPYLKDKAENFSDKIINNTPNGIIVLNEDLEIQQINQAACEILNVGNASDVLNQPIIRITDPTDYFLAVTNQENVNGKEKYLAQYKKYVEETIIYDKEYHIVMIIMKDITNLELARNKKAEQSQRAVEITDKVVEKQMRVVQEIASLLGETTAETKVALTKLKETLRDE